MGRGADRPCLKADLWRRQHGFWRSVFLTRLYPTVPWPDHAQTVEVRRPVDGALSSSEGDFPVLIRPDFLERRFRPITGSPRRRDQSELCTRGRRHTRNKESMVKSACSSATLGNYRKMAFTLRGLPPTSKPNASPFCHLPYAGMFDPGKSFGKSVGMFP